MQAPSLGVPDRPGAGCAAGSLPRFSSLGGAQLIPTVKDASVHVTNSHIKNIEVGEGRNTVHYMGHVGMQRAALSDDVAIQFRQD